MNKKLKTLVVLLFGFSFSLIRLDAKRNDYDDYIIRNGYLIYFYTHGWFFQPCDDKDVIFQESLNSSSFSIYFGTDGYNFALEDFENKHFEKMNVDTVFYHQIGKEGNHVGEIKYKYVQMKYKNGLLQTKTTQNIPLCTVELSIVLNENKKYKLGCFWFEAVIDKIILLN